MCLGAHRRDGTGVHIPAPSLLGGCILSELEREGGEGREVGLPALLHLARSPLLFGYAKPVPLSFGNLRRPRRDIIVAIPGPRDERLHHHPRRT